MVLVGLVSDCVHLRHQTGDGKIIHNGFILGVGQDRVRGIASCYGLDGPGIESQSGQDFLHMSRLALGPTQPPVQ
jgi:hypothetical protein